MDKKANKYVAVAYKLYATADGNTELVEEATEEKPFQFITGFGITLDEFENQIYALDKDAEFDFVLSKDQAYGDYEDARVLNLDKSMFSINGHFDHDNIYKDAIVPLQNEDGNRFLGHVLEVTDDTVTMDLNHPLAGMELNFKGKVVESREATNQEIEGMMNRLSDEGCSCGCGGGCGGGCGQTMSMATIMNVVATVTVNVTAIMSTDMADVMADMATDTAMTAAAATTDKGLHRWLLRLPEYIT